MPRLNHVNGWGWGMWDRRDSDPFGCMPSRQDTRRVDTYVGGDIQFGTINMVPSTHLFFFCQPRNLVQRPLLRMVRWTGHGVQMVQGLVVA